MEQTVEQTVDQTVDQTVGLKSTFTSTSSNHPYYLISLLLYTIEACQQPLSEWKDLSYGFKRYWIFKNDFETLTL